MIVKVVPLPSQQGVKFDLILPTGHVATIAADEYQLRAFRASMAEVVEALVLEWLSSNDFEVDSVSIVFC